MADQGDLIREIENARVVLSFALFGTDKTRYSLARLVEAAADSLKVRKESATERTEADHVTEKEVLQTVMDHLEWSLRGTTSIHSSPPERDASLKRAEVLSHIAFRLMMGRR